jgi:hypothetical protein
VPIYLDPVGIVESAPRDNADAWKLLETQHNSCCAPVAEVQPQPKIAFIGALFVCSKPIARLLDILLIEESMNAQRTTGTPLTKGAITR